LAPALDFYEQDFPRKIEILRRSFPWAHKGHSLPTNSR
jgi:hypothetical protein